MLTLFSFPSLTTLWFFLSLRSLLNFLNLLRRGLVIRGIIYRRHVWVLLIPIEVLIDHLCLLKLLNLWIMPLLSVRWSDTIRLSVIGPWHHLMITRRANLVLMRREHRLLLHHCIHAWTCFKLVTVLKPMRILPWSIVRIIILSLALIMNILRLLNLRLLLILPWRLFLDLLIDHLLVLLLTNHLLLNEVLSWMINLKLFGQKEVVPILLSNDGSFLLNFLGFLSEGFRSANILFFRLSGFISRLLATD